MERNFEKKLTKHIRSVKDDHSKNRSNARGNECKCKWELPTEFWKDCILFIKIKLVLK